MASSRATYLSKRWIRTIRSGWCSTNLYGPLPIGEVILSLPYFAASSAGMMIASAWERKTGRMPERGSLKSRTTVYLSGTVILSSAVRTSLPRGAMSLYRLSDASTSAEVTSLSLWKVTPFRSVMVTFLPSLEGSYFSSRSIFGACEALRVKRPSKTCQPKFAVTVAVVNCGSSAGGSPIVAHFRVPPFFGSPPGLAAAGLASAAGFASTFGAGVG